MEFFEVSRNHGKINQEPSVNEQLGGSGGTKSPRRPEALARGGPGGRDAPPGKKSEDSSKINQMNSYRLGNMFFELVA